MSRKCPYDGKGERSDFSTGILSEEMHDKAGWYVFRSVPGTGGGVRRVWRRPSTLEALRCPRSPRPPSAILDAAGAQGETYTSRNAEHRTR